MGTMVYSILIVSIFGIAIAQQISTSSSTSSPVPSTSAPEVWDATIGGKYGNPGAKIRFSSNGLDAIYAHALKKIAEAIQNMKLPDVMVPIDSGTLTIKSSRITEIKIPNYDRQLLPPNEIKSRLYGGSMKSVGEWQFKPYGGSRSFGSGTYQTTVENTELNMTNKLEKNWEGKPIVQTTACKADLGQSHVEIEGFGDNVTTIEDCDNLLCKRIRAYFEDLVCNSARNYVKDVINRKLATFPVRIELGQTGSLFILDYRLMSSDSVTEKFIQGDLEGEVLSRGVYTANFYAANLSVLDMGNRAISFSLSDYAFNTLLYHAHNQQHRFSVHHLLGDNSAIMQSMALNCSGSSSDAVRHLNPGVSSTTRKTTTRPTTKSTTTKPTTKPTTTKSTTKPSTKSTAKPTNPKIVRNGTNISLGTTIGISRCLGLIFDNVTDGQFPADSIGDLVFKSQRPLQVIVHQQPKKSQFFTTGGTIEVYSTDAVLSQSGSGRPTGSANRIKNRHQGRPDQLLLRADVKLLRGEFTPQLDGSNITGIVSITEFELSQSSSASIQSRTRSSENTLSKLAQFSKPLLVQMFNTFLEKYAQFPVPLVDGYEISQPALRLSSRTMQVDGDVRVLPQATRKT